MLSLRSSALLSTCAAVGARLQGSAALTTTSAASKVHGAAQKKSVGKSDPEDAFIFRSNCKGKREMSEEAKETAEILRRNDFGSLKRKPTAVAQAAAGQRSMHSSTSWAAGDQQSADVASQELVEKGSKRLMQSEDGREELRQGTFDLEGTTDKVLQEGKEEASPETASCADDKDVKEAVKTRVISMSQTS